jgi:hypothetical protein
MSPHAGTMAVSMMIVGIPIAVERVQITFGERV